jgi:hypothetical protein
MMRTSRPAVWFLFFAFLSLGPLLPAQSSGGQNAQSGVNSGGSVTHPLQVAVTGCLKSGGEGRGYYIADKNGTTWKLVPNGVSLAEQVNHSVMITGRPVANKEGDHEQGGKREEGGKPQPGLKVLTIKMLSPSCTR